MFVLMIFFFWVADRTDFSVRIFPFGFFRPDFSVIIFPYGKNCPAKIRYAKSEVVTGGGGGVGRRWVGGLCVGVQDLFARKKLSRNNP